MQHKLTTSRTIGNVLIGSHMAVSITKYGTSSRFVGMAMWLICTSVVQ